MTDLRARRDAQTRAEISTAAIALFAERGYGSTTMEDVATAAGVSRRTAYRYFSNKEDLLFEQTRVWMEVLDRAVDARQPGESTREMLRRAVLDVARHIEARPDETIAGWGVVATTPALQARYARTNREWLDRYVAVIAADVDAGDTAAVLRAAVIAGALVGGTDQTVRLWFQVPEASLVALTEEVLETVEPLWLPASRASR